MHSKKRYLKVFLTDGNVPIDNNASLSSRYFYPYLFKDQTAKMNVFRKDEDKNSVRITERKSHPWILYREENWQVIDTINGATSSAIIYRITETTKANNLKPYDYFKYLLAKVPKYVDDLERSFLEDLFHGSDKLPEHIRKPKRRINGSRITAGP